MAKDIFRSDAQPDETPDQVQSDGQADGAESVEAGEEVSSLDDMYEYMDADMAERNLRGIRAAVARWKAKQGGDVDEKGPPPRA